MVTGACEVHGVETSKEHKGGAWFEDMAGVRAHVWGVEDVCRVWRCNL